MTGTLLDLTPFGSLLSGICVIYWLLARLLRRCVVTNEFLDVVAEGDDTLLGGAGRDTYRFAAGWGFDTVRDSDGAGSIEVTGLGVPVDGSNARKIADGSWQSLDKKITYTLAQVTDTRSDLFLSFADRLDVIRIQEWSAQNNLGITLPDAVVPPVVTPLFNGDIAKQNNGTAYTRTSSGYASAGAEANAADVFNGTAADEVIKGLGGNDGLSGGEGADLLDGGEGDDLLLGGFGADTLKGGNGNDFIFGSAMGVVDTPAAMNFKPPAIAGNAVEAARGFSWVASRATGQRWKNDTASFLGVAINGADAQPFFVASNGIAYTENTGNVIDAGAGNDFVSAGTAADTVHGGEGDDDIYGLDGADVLFGDAGSDFIMGDGLDFVGSSVYTSSTKHGNDILIGGAGNDVLIGQGGNDELLGGTEDDQLYGDAFAKETTPLEVHGNDVLDGGDGNDKLLGGGRDDDLFGGSGRDTLWGDNDDDQSMGAFEGKDHLDGGSDNDQLVGGGNDDMLIGGTGSDLLWGDSGRIAKDDGSNFSTTVVVQGRDTLDGGDGNDQLVGGGNDDTLFGGAGNDLLAGDDDISLLAASAHGADLLDGQDGADSLWGGAGNDTLLGGNDDDFLWGEDGNDSLSGGAGSDALNGGAGYDTLDGGAGDDYLYGGTGYNAIVFGAGSGHDFLDASGTFHIQLSEGTTLSDIQFARKNDDLFLVLPATGDVLQISKFFVGSLPYLLHLPNCDPSAFVVSFDDGSSLNIEEVAARASATTLEDDFLVAFKTSDRLFVPGAALSGGDGNDYLFGEDAGELLDGGTGADTLEGYGGADTLFGGTGNDKVDGGDGADYVDGGEGSDTLSGGAGNDTLVGGGGLQFGLPSNDFLSGGTGHDTYIFERGFGRDVVSEIDSADTPTSNIDTLQMGAGIAPSDLIISRGLENQAYGLLISVNGTNDVIELVNPLSGTSPGNNQLIERITFVDGTVWDAATIKAKALISTPGNDLIFGHNDSNDSISGGDGNDTLYGFIGADTLSGGNGNDLIDGNGGNGDGTLDGADLLDGGAGADSLRGGMGNDTLFGGSGNDTLFGDEGGDYLDGGTGDDSLSGFMGVDTYAFGIGSGRDVIYDNTLYEAPGSLAGIALLGAGLLPSDVTLIQASNDDLLINVSSTSDQLRILNYFNNSYSTFELQFANGTVWDTAAIASHLSNVTTPTGITINGTTTADFLVGGAGPDALSGLDGNDSLDGGAGADVLDGGAGSDRYFFGRDSGQDTVNNFDPAAGNVDEIRLGSGIASTDLIFTRDGDSLVIGIRGTADSLRVNSHFLPTYQIDRVVFVDGTTLDAATIANLLLDGGEGVIYSGASDANLLTGGVGSDRLFGGAGSDTLLGGSGDDRLIGGDDADELRGGTQNDTLLGGAGSDVLYGDAGADSLKGEDGNDTLEGGRGSDTLDGGLGNDTYRFNIGDGNDLISSSDVGIGKFDVLRMGPGITPINLSVSAVYGRTTSFADLLFSIHGTSDSIRIDSFFANDAAGGSQIEQIIFDDGTVWGVADIRARAVLPTTQDDFIQGFSTADALLGGGGNDGIFGLGGNDSINGGDGEDALSGGDGDDLIEGGAQRDQLYGDAGNDVLRGQAGNDTLYGGAGNDLIEGGDGDDQLQGGDQFLHV
jgi:Ca2+-binding RTX toxin-like protein